MKPTTFVELTEAAIRYILKLVIRDRKATQRRREKKPFTPEPGRRDASEFKIGKCRELETALTKSLDEISEGDADIT